LSNQGYLFYYELAKTKNIFQRLYVDTNVLEMFWFSQFEKASLKSDSSVKL